MVTQRLSNFVKSEPKSFHGNNKTRKFGFRDKTINDLNPSFMKNIFSAKQSTRVRPNDILVKTHKPATFGDKTEYNL